MILGIYYVDGIASTRWVSILWISAIDWRVFMLKERRNLIDIVCTDCKEKAYAIFYIQGRRGRHKLCPDCYKKRTQRYYTVTKKTKIYPDL